MVLRRLFRGRQQALTDPAPEARRPAPAEPAARSGAAQPDAAQPDVAQPDAAQPAAAEVAGLPPAAAAQRLRELDDPETVVDIVLKARGEVRELALQHPALKHPSALARLEKRSRDRDKSVNRHARTLLDRYRQLAGDAETRAARIHELKQALERSAPTQPDTAWSERQHQLHERLDAALDEYAAVRAQLATFDAPPDDLEALRGDPAALPPLSPEAPAPAAAEPAIATSTADPFESLVSQFEALDQALLAGRPFPEVAGERQSLTDQWLTAADHQPPDDAQHAVFEAVSHRFRELADAVERLAGASLPALPQGELAIRRHEDAGAHRQLWEEVERRRGALKQLQAAQRRVRWPDWAPATDGYAELSAAAASLSAELERADELLAEELKDLDAQLEALTSAIDDGHLNDAQSLLARCRVRHDALPPSAGRSAAKRLRQQGARLAELRDWQTFATSPKRESLLEAMSALASSPLEPKAQADRIKSLRQEWQSLGPVSHGGDGRLADRFNAAAEQAFEPCRAYFAAQAEERAANLVERQRICDQLQRYLAETDWARADMKGAESILRTARDEWRRFHPVDRSAGKAVDARFEDLQTELHDRVKAEWDRNLAAKQAIVARARELLDAERPVADKVEEAKRLQREWRDVGITPRRPDQRLWRDFRAACDGIFAARDENRQAADAATEALVTELTARLDEFATALEHLDPAAANDATLKAFRQQTAEVDHLPPPRRRDLAARRQDLTARYAGLLEQAHRAARTEALLALARWDEAITRMETARAAGAEVEVPELPADIAELAAQRLAAGDASLPLDAARRLTVKAELAAGRESPEADEPLRLELQVERLQAGLSGGGTTPQEPRALAEAWCRLGPKDADFAPLRERLFAALTALV